MTIVIIAVPYREYPSLFARSKRFCCVTYRKTERVAPASHRIAAVKDACTGERNGVPKWSGAGVTVFLTIFASR
jgi:hypothetical protein